MLLDTENFSSPTGLPGVLKHKTWYIPNILEGLKANHSYFQSSAPSRAIGVFGLIFSITDAMGRVALGSLFSEGFSSSVMGNKPVNKCMCKRGITQV